MDLSASIWGYTISEVNVGKVINELSKVKDIDLGFFPRQQK